jgi:hypothetical protein
MNSRERVIRAIAFDRPDRIPVMHSVALTCFIKYGERLAEVLQKYPQDFAPPTMRYPKVVDDLPPTARRGAYTDEWGCRVAIGVDGLFGQPTGDPPLAEEDRLAGYTFPRSWSADEIERMGRQVSEKKKSYFTMSYFQIGCGYFERLQWLMGYENLMIRLMERSGPFVKFADDLLEWSLARIGALARVSPATVSLCCWEAQRSWPCLGWARPSSPSPRKTRFSGG